MGVMRFLFACALFLAAQSAMAETFAVGHAADCIRKSQVTRSQTLTNTCDKAVIVIWCHDRDQAGYRAGRCGTGKNFYQMNRTLKPGETMENMFSLPLSSTVTYGACFGGYASFKRLEKEGDYLCLADREKMEETVATAHAAGREDACDKARAMSEGHAIVGSCVCEERGKTKKVTTCRVKSLDPKQDSSMHQKAKEKMREHLQQCDPARDMACPLDDSRKTRNGGPGIRG